eukprot:TRINITY_DN4123_c0_g2_i1.p1 TRINITY_DN4123_c0_g2~~TRINITY_DN4123_c0_g2_i1.p1  ORF type:complete len:288 (-),score=8.96 TRINITY_DN4123_c0_g2_i1:66-929(-)
MIPRRLILNNSKNYSKRGLLTLGTLTPSAKFRLESPTSVAVIQGATGGIGSEFTRQLLVNTKSKVIATARNPHQSPELNTLKELYPDRLSLVALDVSNKASIEAASAQIKSITSNVDLLVNCSGVLHTKDFPMLPEKKFSDFNEDQFLYSMRVNALGPTLFTKEIIALLVADRKSRNPAVVANLSARTGSISDNNLGGWYSYRATKATLNMLTKTASVEHKRSGICFVNLHPGTVATKMSALFTSNIKPDKILTPEASVKKLLDVINALELTDSGEFLDYSGLKIQY